MAITRTRLQIGDWWMDHETCELTRGDTTVRIEPKAMGVLSLLADRAGEVVRREELFADAWPGVVVGDEALTQSIIKLRRALGDNPRSPSYIETISKRGYRLIAPVRRDAVTIPASDIPALELRSGVAPRGRRDVGLFVLIAGVVFAMAAIVYQFHDVPRATAISDDAESGDLRVSSAVTVAVLPFESLGPGSEQAYLARGITNDLMTDLSRLPGLRVIQESGATPGNPAVRGARYVISGSVQRVADSLRINIRLIDTETNQQLWSERFERRFGDLFAVQDDMIRRLTEVLPGKLTDAARQRVAQRYTGSLEAYDYFLRGQALFLVRHAEENEQARAMYRKALELDPKFARAYAGLAMTYAMDSRLRRSGDSAPALVRALELAETARQIDADIPEVHWALGFVHAQTGSHEQAIQELNRAIELNRSFADAYALLGGIYTYVGQPAKSIPLLRTAQRLNPDGGYLYFLLLGRAYLFENDVEQALINLREASARNPVDLETRIYLAAAMAAEGDRSGARWAADEVRALDVDFSLQRWFETYPLTSTRHREMLADLLAKAGL